MRDWEEIQRAHDMLKALLNEEIPDANVIGDHNREVWFAVLSGICWVLGHDYGGLFSDNIAKIEESIEGSGFVFGLAPPGIDDIDTHPPHETIGPFSLN